MPRRSRSRPTPSTTTDGRPPAACGRADARQAPLVNRFLEGKVSERTEEVRETQLEIIRRLATAAEFRDDVTGAHIYRMSQYSAVVARGAGLSDQDAEHLLVAAPMHDVGKIGVPDDVLNKPGKLTEEEFATMRNHTTWGAQILAGSNSSWIKLAQRVALEHHERWDGKGYPQGLAGEEIMLEARICSGWSCSARCRSRASTAIPNPRSCAETTAGGASSPFGRPRDLPSHKQ